MVRNTKLERDKPRLNNTQFITELMDFSELGGIMHAFVLECLRVYAKEVISRQNEIPDNGLMSRELWVACANECLEKLEKRANG